MRYWTKAFVLALVVLFAAAGINEQRAYEAAAAGTTGEPSIFGDLMSSITLVALAAVLLTGLVPRVVNR